ncbi:MULTISPECIES: hypothetical protein [unclassified Streptomyces]|uniref:hypothetical protein n=1 Tax=unclassified Streptomyces TaxID=2593676 RepID=UPI00035C4D0F|nr:MULTISPECIES: hypothetical protein [unclassified Streptomyces]MYT32594.1 hypothetical protein [Streptomyces sp. SID8354]
MNTPYASPKHGGHEHIHRFLILGKEKLFFYHLSLYNPDLGHHYQAVFTFEIEGDDLKKMYLEDLKKNEDKRVFYALRCPHHFELPELKNGKEFRVYLERVVVQNDGSRKFEQMTPTEAPVPVTCRPQDVLYFRDMADRPLPYPQRLTYLAFGAGKEVHLAHQLAERPNWDEVITVTTKQSIDDATLKQVPPVVIDSINDPHGVIKESLLKKDQQYQGKISAGNQTVDFIVGRQGWWNHTSLNTA